MKLVLIVLVILFFNMAKGETVVRPEVSFASVIEISNHENIKLGDLVTIKNGSEELLSLLDGVSVKQKETYSAREISALIKFELENNSSLQKLNPSFKIPSEVQLKISKVPVSKAEVERRVGNILKTRCADCEFKVQVQNTPFPASGPWEIDYSALTLKGSFLISLRDTDAKSIKWISGSVKIMKPIPVAARFLQANERVEAKDVKMELTDVTFAKDNSLQMSDITGQVLQRSLQPNAPIWSSDLKREAATKRGQTVRAVLGNEDFEISTQMQAEENGFVGDTIRLKSMENQKILSGVIIEKGVVKIQ